MLDVRQLSTVNDKGWARNIANQLKKLSYLFDFDLPDKNCILQNVALVVIVITIVAVIPIIFIS